MTEIRALFSQAVDAAAPLLAEPALAGRFEQPSALAEFSVRGLAGHLLRAMTSPETYLDLADPFHQAIRQRGLEAAPADPGDFPGLWAATATRLGARFGAEAPGRRVQVFGDLVLTLDEYLVTRLIELVVHTDDLAVSLDVGPPPLPAAASGLVIATLVEVARIRHGDTPVVRALTRRERDTVDALRVI